MTYLEMLRALTVEDDIKIQPLRECVTNLRAVKRTKNTVAHTKIEFCTQHTQPSDFMPGCVPERIGVVVWIPTTLYNSLADTPDGVARRDLALAEPTS